MRFVALLVLFVLVLARVDRFFLKKNDGFCLSHIYPSSSCPCPRACPCPISFPDKFFYLSKGHQSYVFVSADQKTVLKFYRFPSHMRKHAWSRKRPEIKAYNEKKFYLSMQSYQLAFDQLKEETGLLFVHLTPTPEFRKRVTLIDKLGHPYKVELNDLPFLLQKKGEPLFPLLTRYIQEHNEEGAKEIISQVISLIASRSKKGIADKDAILEKNYGWCDGRALHLDVGRFLPEQGLDPSREAAQITHSLRTWLTHNAPELLPYYLTQLSLTVN